jgi:hypothetical protein
MVGIADIEYGNEIHWMVGFLTEKCETCMMDGG